MRLHSIASSIALTVVCTSFLASASDTAPFLAFSSRQSHALDKGLSSRSSISSPYVSPRDITSSLTKRGSDVCNFAAVAIVEVDDLHSHSFQSLPRTSYLQSRALEAPSQIAFPHVSLSHGDTAAELRHALQLACRKIWAGADRITTFSVPSIQDEAIAHPLTTFTQENPHHLIAVTTASRKLIMRKRADSNDSNSDTDAVMDSKLGLLHRYQFFSTGLLVAVLVMVILLLPAVYSATSLLANIETPDRLGEKSRSSGDKKSQ